MTLTMLVDGNNLAMRSIHAMAHNRLSSGDVSTGPLLVFINALSKFVKDERPDRVSVCWDHPGESWREVLFPEYKAHRVRATEMEEMKTSTFGLVQTLLAYLNIGQMKYKGLEADDIIAIYTQWARNNDSRVVIASSDKDFLQLLRDDEVEQIRLSSGGAPTDRWTADRVRDEYNCEPYELPLAMALAGDAGDNVPGIRGFGMKTAVKALHKHGWDLRANDHPKVAENRAQVLQSYDLVDLVTPYPLELPPVPEFKPTTMGDALFPTLIDFLNQYEMESVKSRIYDRTLWSNRKDDDG